QSFILHATTAVFLYYAFILIPGHLLKRIVICVLLGGMLLSPLVIIWPTIVMTEAMTLPAILLFACACLAADARTRWAPIVVAMTCCLLVLVRDPIIYFVWMFAALLWTNMLFAITNWTRLLMIGPVLMLLAVGLGIARASLLVDGMQDRS